jgi:hypothetical protein
MFSFSFPTALLVEEMNGACALINMDRKRNGTTNKGGNFDLP